MRIREIKAEDESRWRNLWRGYLVFYGSDVPEEVTASTFAAILDAQSAVNGLVAVNDEDQIVGFTHYVFHPSTWTKTSYCYLEDLFVDPETRGGGAGRKLIEAVKERAENAGSTRVYWHTQHFNETARKLYDQVATLSPFVQYRA